MTKIPLKSAKNKPKSSFLWGLIQFAPNSNIKHLVYSHKNVPTELPRSGSSTDTLQKCHIWQLCPSDIRLTKKNWSTFFWSKTLSKIRLLQIFLFLREKSKSGQVRFFFSQREIENLDTSRFFIFNVKIKIRTRPDFYFSMQNFRSGLGDM